MPRARATREQCTCGSTEHDDVRVSCPLNQQRSKTSSSSSSVRSTSRASSSGGRATGSSSGRGGRSVGDSGNPPSWTKLPAPAEIELQWASDFRKIALDVGIEEHIRQVQRNLRHDGLTASSSVLDVFNVLAGNTFDELRDFVNAGIRASTATATTTATTSDELRSWFAQILFYSICQFSKGAADDVLSFLCKKNGHVEGDQEPRLLSRQRHRKLTKHLFPFNPVTVAAVGSTSFRDRTDDTPHVWEFVRRALEPTTRIAITEFSYLVIDHWLSGLRSKDIRVKSKNNKKARQWGFMSDMLCDVVLRVIVDVRHRERGGYNQDEAMRAIFEKRFEAVRTQLNDVIVVAADRGYVKEKLWLTLSRLSSRFVLICDPDFRTTGGNPFVGASSRFASSYEAGFRVPDGNMLGPTIECASADVSHHAPPDGDGSPDDVPPVYAYAVRTTKTVKKKPKVDGNPRATVDRRRQILRFLTHKTGLENQLRKNVRPDPQREAFAPQTHRNSVCPRSTSCSLLPIGRTSTVGEYFAASRAL